MKDNSLQSLRKKYEEQKARQAGDGGGEFSDKFISLAINEEADIRLLPYGEEQGDFVLETAVHYIGDEKNKQKYHCPRVVGEEGHKECPICDAYFDVWKDINAMGKDNPATMTLQKFARGLRASSRYYFNAIDRRDGKVKILSQGYKVYEKIMDGMFDPEIGGENDVPVFDLKEGWDFKMHLVKVGEHNNYDKSKFKKNPSPAGTDAEIARYLDERHDLSKMVTVAEYSDLKEAAAGIKAMHQTLVAPKETQDMPGTSDEGMGDEEFEKSLNS